MSVDTTSIGSAAASLMEALADLTEDVEGVEVGVVAVIAEIHVKDADGIRTAIHFQCSDPRQWVQCGLFDAASTLAGRTLFEG